MVPEQAAKPQWARPLRCAPKPPLSDDSAPGQRRWQHLRPHGPGGGAGGPGAPFAVAGDAQRRPAATGSRLGLPGPAHPGRLPGHGAERSGGAGLPRSKRHHPPQAGGGGPLPRAQPPGPKAGGGEHAGAPPGRGLVRHQHRRGGLPGTPAGLGKAWASGGQLGGSTGAGAGLRRQCQGRGGSPGGAGLGSDHPGGPAGRQAGYLPGGLPRLGAAIGDPGLARAGRGQRR